MDQITLVDNLIVAGHQFLGDLVQNQFDVAAAAWIKASDEDSWYLYIATKEVDAKGTTAAYRTLHEKMQRMPPPVIPFFEIKLIGADNPIAQEIVEFYRRQPAPWLVHHRSYRLGNLSIEDAYVYPPPSTEGEHGNGTAVSVDEVRRKVFERLSSNGTPHPTEVTLRDGSHFRGAPFGVEIIEGAMNVKFAVEGATLPRIIKVTEISGIQ
jgi:hypothetical protein